MGPINTLGYLLQHATSIMYRQSDQILQERLGIGMSQYKLLMMLQYESNVQQRALAESLGQTEASISRQIKLLAEKGMLAVKVNPKNKREHVTAATPKGIKVTVAAREVLAEYQTPVFDQFNEKQLQQMTEMLTQMHMVICQPGRPHACDHPFDLGGSYDEDARYLRAISR
jgi:Transcriptional regulators